MTKQRLNAPYYTRIMYRLVAGIFGLFLAGLGIYAILFAGPLTALQLVGGTAFVLFGVNMAFSASRAKESWLSKMGPWP